ncbi:cytochrome P450 6k1-like [Schistocerca piceifrons]|uniref:cytochrome P450 6k1-like n=1 Tax=Schistocerca piceifrons TaxID=274613 RepID=UPI001F5FB20A|nr:cytochrome P450 6k1-like [Schistocerca piceifrons]XP_047117855.1 cytochrome P450 6k1-like [Schistocerca piceifrons]
MAFYAESWLAELLVALSLVVAAAYVWFSHSYKYWKKKGAPYLEPQFPFGNVYKSFVGKLSMPLDIVDAYWQLKGNRFGGIYFFTRPTLVVLDPDLIRCILVKDFWTFQDRMALVNENEPISQHLFAIRGNKWRRLRVKLTPTFTSGKMKMMFQTVADCGREMVEVLQGPASRGEVVEMRELSARYSTDVIASVAFGIQVDCQRNPENEFRQWGRRVFEPGLLATLNALISSISPKLLTTLRVKSNLSVISAYFRGMVRETVKYREENNITRNDFMQLMIQLKNKGSVDSAKGGEHEEVGGDVWKLSIDDVAAQAFVFFIAGFETSSTTMSFALHELAHHPDVQARLHEEIDSVLKQHSGQVTYDAISSMHYLDKVVAETLRKYPPIPLLNRICNRDYKIPDSDVVVDKGTSVIIPVYGLHHDPQIFPDPERFDPERFSEEQKAQRHPYVYLPFGEGPRNCIGMRFGLLQTKVGLTNVLGNFSVVPCEKTVRHLSFEPRSVILKPKSGIQLRLKKRNKV